MTIWVISDTHFHHQNMYKFTMWDGGPRVRERFANAEEGDAYMIERWNAIVKPEDHVWHLGDVGFTRDAIEVVRRLNGHKRLVLGNHDKENVTFYREVGFQKVVGARQADGLLMTHYPVHPSSIGFRVIANVHGHIHEKVVYKDNLETGAYEPDLRYINVSVEHINYEPVPLEVLIDRARAARVAAEEAK